MASPDLHEGHTSDFLNTSSPHDNQFDPAMHQTFFFMERRRLHRQVCGKHTKRGLLSSLTEMGAFLGFTVYALVYVRTEFLHFEAADPVVVWMPVLLTVLLVGISLRQMLVVREHWTLLWAKTWGWLLIVWWLWVSNAENFFVPKDAEKNNIVLIVYIVLQSLTFTLWVVISKCYPRLLKFVKGSVLLRIFWRVRASTKAGWMSYRPNGPCCRRREFQYIGDLRDGQPHGHGVWCNNHNHGEVVKGMWRDGKLVAPFFSRTYGTGSMSKGLIIGYGTVRDEDLRGLYYIPTRGRLRFGTLGVECSVAGGFLAHLPEVFEHTCGNLEHVVGKFKEMSQHTIGSLTECESYRERDDPWCSPVFSSCMDARETGLPGRKAIVFVHGLDSTIETGCVRLGQLLALGKFNPSVMPFVFSWSCGTTPTYFAVRKRLPSLAQDFGPFLEALSAAGIVEVHLLAHSVGCEIVTEALPELQRLRSALTISTVSFISATNDCDRFFKSTSDRPCDLDGLLSVSKRVTLYCDSDNTLLALFSPKAVGRHGPCEFSRCSHCEDPRFDLIDCTSMDTTARVFRHSCFDLNTHLVTDLHELLNTQHSASKRTRLVRLDVEARPINLFSFLAPPIFVKNS